MKRKLRFVVNFLIGWGLGELADAPLWWFWIVGVFSFGIYWMEDFTRCAWCGKLIDTGGKKHEKHPDGWFWHCSPKCHQEHSASVSE